MTLLSVRAVAHPGSSSRHPGDTALLIDTSPFAHATVTLRRYGVVTKHYQARPTAPSATAATLTVQHAWTCARPGGSYSYVVTATQSVGRAITRTGHFQPITAARCEALKRRQ